MNDCSRGDKEIVSLKSDLFASNQQRAWMKLVVVQTECIKKLSVQRLLAFLNSYEFTNNRIMEIRQNSAKLSIIGKVCHISFKCLEKKNGNFELIRN